MNNKIFLVLLVVATVFVSTNALAKLDDCERLREKVEDAREKCEDPVGNFDCDDFYRYRDFYNRVCRKVNEEPLQ